MNIVITGASGFIGSAASKNLRKAGHTVRPLSLRTAPGPDALAGADAVVHLAGEPVLQRWTSAARERIRASRVEGTRVLVEAMQRHKPQVLISGSAVGYYGDRGEDIVTEADPPARDFLGEVAVAWEKEAQAAESLGVRVARIRTGVVYGPGGGALSKMLLPFKLGLGGRIGSGRQWTSWIHLDDLVSLIAFLIKESTVRGAFNAVSTHPVTNTEFTRALAAALHRPAILPIPPLALKLLYGSAADVMLASQRVIPDAAIRAGFTFRYPDIYGALAHAVQ